MWSEAAFPPGPHVPWPSLVQGAHVEKCSPRAAEAEGPEFASLRLLVTPKHQREGGARAFFTYSGCRTSGSALCRGMRALSASSRPCEVSSSFSDTSLASSVPQSLTGASLS